MRCRDHPAHPARPEAHGRVVGHRRKGQRQGGEADGGQVGLEPTTDDRRIVRRPKAVGQRRFSRDSCSVVGGWLTPEEGHFRSGVPPRCHAVSRLKGPRSKPSRGRSTGHEGCRDQRTPDRRSAPNCPLSRGDQPPPVQWLMAREHRLWSESRDAPRREFLCSTMALRWMVARVVLAVSDPAGTSWVPREIVGVRAIPEFSGLALSSGQPGARDGGGAHDEHEYEKDSAEVDLDLPWPVAHHQLHSGPAEDHS